MEASRSALRLHHIAAHVCSGSANASGKPLRVLVTGAAGQIGYALAFRIASGYVFGPDRQVILHLLDLAQMKESLEGVAMELDDCAFPLLHSTYQTLLLTADVALHC